MSNKVVREKMVGAPPEAESDQEDKKAAPRRVKTTMGELGPMLPVGYLVGGALVKELKDRPWKTKDERELAKLKKPKMSMASYITMVVAQMFSKFGPHSLPPDMKNDEKKVLLGQAYMGDLFYAYMWLRTQVIGPELKMDITCPQQGCGSFRFVGDLLSTEVNTVTDIESLDWFYELKNPVELRKVEVTKFRLRAPLWHTLVSSTAGDFNESLGKIMVVQGSIIGLNDDDGIISLTDGEMDELSKFDLESIAQKANAEYVGPKMGVEGKCPRCEMEFQAPIDWSYDRFFTTSSL